MEIKQRRDYIELVEGMYNEISPYIVKVFNVNPWPLIRIQTSYFLHLLFVGRTNIKIQKLEKNDQRIKALIKGILYLIKYKIQLLLIQRKFKGLLCDKPLLVGFKKHESKYLGETLNIYLNPFEVFFSELNIDSYLLYLDKKGDKEKNDLELFFTKINSYTNTKIKLKSYFSSASKTEYKKARELYKYISEYLNNKQVPYADNIAAIIHNSIIKNEEFYHSFLFLLKITQPRVIINYVYYDNKMMALQRASNQLNIPLVEYQHSLQADDHLAYAPWKDIDNYASFFPSNFWVWSIKDANRIKKNFSGEKYQPNVIVGGNPFLAQQKAKFTATDNSADNKATHVLITLQGSWIPQFIEEVIKSKPSYKWYFRLHPRYPDDKIKLDEFYNQFPDRVEIEEANQLSLYSLFQKVRFNITSSSGTALEASAFDVTNLIFGQDGYNCFESYIKEKAFFFINDAASLVNLLENPAQNHINEESVIKANVQEILNELSVL